MCAYSMGLIISRQCRQNRWCQSCVRGWLPSFGHNLFSVQESFLRSVKPGFLHGPPCRTNEQSRRFNDHHFSLLGQACFSECSSMTSFPGYGSLPFTFCLFRSPSRSLLLHKLYL